MVSGRGRGRPCGRPRATTDPSRRHDRRVADDPSAPALQNVKTRFTDGISGGLKDVSSGIQFFFGAMIVAIGARIVAIIAAIAATSTIVGIPVGVLVAWGPA